MFPRHAGVSIPHRKVCKGESGEYGPDVYDSEVGVFAVIDGEPETVAQPYLEADACLIAAAPRMLEVLEWLSDEYCCRDDSYGVLFTEQDFRRVHAVIREARAFQSTPPGGGRPSGAGEDVRAPGFQSTPPRGGRL